jgi:hypothetical protein
MTACLGGSPLWIGLFWHDFGNPAPARRLPFPHHSQLQKG